MNLNFSALQPEDIQAVLANLWDRSIKEAQLFGYKGKDDIMAYLLASSGEYSFVLKVADEPVAIFGANGHGSRYNSWFVATDGFAKVGVTATRFLKGFIKERIQNRPDAELTMTSAVDHPEAERWFKTLGFKLIKQEGVFSYYEYQNLTKH